MSGSNNRNRNNTFWQNLARSIVRINKNLISNVFTLTVLFILYIVATGLGATRVIYVYSSLGPISSLTNSWYISIITSIVGFVTILNTSVIAVMIYKSLEPINKTLTEILVSQGKLPEMHSNLKDVRKTLIEGADSQVVKVANLEKDVTSLKVSVGNLETSVGKLETSVGNLETRVGNLEISISGSQPESILNILKRMEAKIDSK
jgi:low affinity Fe/Cu permease